MSRFGVAEIIALIAPAYLVAVAVPLAIIDVRQRRLPNRLVLPGLVIAIFSQLGASAISGRWQNLLTSLSAGVVAFLLCWAINSIGAIGMGDVKLIALITMSLAWFDWIWPVAALAGAFVLATVLVLLGYIFRRSKLGATIPLGPYLLIGFGASLTALVLS